MPGSDVTHTSGQEAGAALFTPALEAAVARATAPLVAEREAARSERLRFQEASAAREAPAQAQAEELGRERALRQVAEERAAHLERTVRRQQRPWWPRLLG